MGTTGIVACTAAVLADKACGASAEMKPQEVKPADAQHRAPDAKEHRPRKPDGFAGLYWVKGHIPEPKKPILPPPTRPKSPPLPDIESLLRPRRPHVPWELPTYPDPKPPPDPPWPIINPPPRVPLRRPASCQTTRPETCEKSTQTPRWACGGVKS